MTDDKLRAALEEALPECQEARWPEFLRYGATTEHIEVARAALRLNAPNLAAALAAHPAVRAALTPASAPVAEGLRCPDCGFSAEEIGLIHINAQVAGGRHLTHSEPPAAWPSADDEAAVEEPKRRAMP